MKLFSLKKKNWGQHRKECVLYIKNKLKEGYKWYSARHDKVFKCLFGGEENKEMLEQLLSHIFKRKVHIIKYFTNELILSKTKERSKTVDLYLQMDEEYLILELNNGLKDYTNFRNFCYLCSGIVNKTKSGEDYDISTKHVLLDLTYGIKNKFGEFDHTTYTVSSKEIECSYIDNVEIIEYDMDKIMEYYKKNDKEKIEENKYLIMLDLDYKKLDNFCKGDRFMKQFNDKIMDLNNNEEFQFWITPEEDERFCHNTDISIAKEEGHASGLVEGRASGLIEGEKNGILQSAKKFIEKGMPIEEASETLEIPIEELKKII